MRINKVLMCLIVLLVTGCATVPEQTLDTLIIRNDTSDALYEVSLRVPETTGFVSCSVILPSRDCSVGFPQRKNEKHEAFLSWTQKGQSYTKPLIGGRESKPHHDYPYKAVVVITDNGGLDVYLD